MHTLTPILTTIWQILPIPLAVAILYLLARLVRQSSHAVFLADIIASLRDRHQALAAENHELRQQVAAVHQQAQEMYAAASAARETIRGLERRLDGHDANAELAAARARITYLTGRNNELTIHALANGGKLFKFFAN